MKKSQKARPGEYSEDQEARLALETMELILDLLIQQVRSMKDVRKRMGRIRLWKLVLNTRVPTDAENVVIFFTPKETH